MRNPNGYGGIVNLGKNRRKPYGVRVCTGVDDSDPLKVKCKYKYLGYFEKRKDAIMCLANYNAGNPVEEHIALCKIPTFSELYESWLNEKEIGDNISDNTKRCYKSAYERIKPLHSMKITAINVDVLQNVINNLADESKSSVDHVRIVLNGVFKYALARDYVSKNYASLCRYYGKTSSGIHKIFTHDEINKLWTLSDERIARLLLCLIYTGFRIDEFCSLKTENVHIEEQYIVGGLKTKAGKNRTVPIHNAILPFIKDFLDGQNTYLYSNADKRVSTRTERDKIKKYCIEKLGNEHLPHDTRHTFATLADEAKMDETIVKRIMGHTVSDITKGVYTHYDVEKMLKEINKICC